MKIKNICCIGAGYVGGPTMAVIALKCPNIKVTVVDKSSDKLDSWNGPLDTLPVYEPGLSEIVNKVRDKNLFFSKDIDDAIDNAEMIFMAVNTPTKTEGEGAGMAADLRYIEACALDIARVSNNDKIIVEKSTLPVRTAEKIKDILNQHGKDVNFEILSNPEFLAEGTAIQDLFKSDRVLIGGDSTESGKIAVKSLVDIYSNWIPKSKILTTNVWSSELAKLASNAMLSQRISSINSLSALCEKTEANIHELSKAIGMDHRIGPHFLKVSSGFGGSCFQKDILNLVYLCKYYGLNEVAEYWHQVVKMNDYQKNRFAQKIINQFEGILINRKISILGWAFKANTNDSRESPSIYIAKKLLDAGAHLQIYDPMVADSKILSDLNTYFDNDVNTETLTFCKTLLEANKNTSAIAVLTDWNEFKEFDWKGFTKGNNSEVRIFDGRNFLEDELNEYKYYFKL